MSISGRGVCWTRRHIEKSIGGKVMFILLEIVDINKVCFRLDGWIDGGLVKWMHSYIDRWMD